MMSSCQTLFFYFLIQKGCREMKKEFTEQELAQIREYNRQRRKKWWDSMTKEEQRARRRQWALTAIRKADAEEAAAAAGSETPTA